MDLHASIVAIESSVGNPRDGLPEDVFLLVSRLTPLVNVDLLIKDAEGRTLLTWRDDEYYGRGWHVPGSIIRYKETIDERVRACARDEIGADVTFDPVPLLVLESIDARADRGHMLSLLFLCHPLAPPDSARRAAASPSRGQWRWHSAVPPDLLGVHRRYAPFM
jgi:colanic acid biosynthesis protein WcaH